MLLDQHNRVHEEEKDLLGLPYENRLELLHRRRGAMGGFNLDKLLLFLLCVVLLASEGEKVCGLRSVDHVLRYGEEGGLAEKNRRILANVDAGKKSAAKSSSFDSNSTSKRRVRRGSDPIHNRC